MKVKTFKGRRRGKKRQKRGSKKPNSWWQKLLSLPWKWIIPAGILLGIIILFIYTSFFLPSVKDADQLSFAQSTIIYDRGALNPDNNPNEILALADQVLVMTIKAGKGGQSFMPERLEEVQALRNRGYEGEIEIDGGVKDYNWQEADKAGVDIAVVGSFLMKATSEHRQERIDTLKSL